MLGETLRPSVGKWNNTFNHMKRSARDYFCTYFLSLFHWITVISLRLCLSPLSAVAFSLLPLHAHASPLQMSTAINREFLLNPLHAHAHRHARTHSAKWYITNKAYHSCRITPLCIPTKAYHYKQYNYDCLRCDLCELLPFLCEFWVCLISTHLFLQVYKRGTVACAHNPALTNDSHTLPAPPSLPRSPSFCEDRCAHWQAIPSSIIKRRRNCPCTTTLSALRHTTKTKTPRQAQQCVILGLSAPSSSPGQGSAQLSYRHATALGHHQTKGWEWLPPKHVLLLHTTEDGICSERAAMMNCLLLLARIHAYKYTRVDLYTSICVLSGRHNLLCNVTIFGISIAVDKWIKWYFV